MFPMSVYGERTVLDISTFRWLYVNHRADNLDNDCRKCSLNLPTARDKGDGSKDSSVAPRGKRKKRKGRRRKKVEKRQQQTTTTTTTTDGDGGNQS